MDTGLAECDDEAGKLVQRYAKAGEFCVVVRTFGNGQNVRTIFPQVAGAVKTSQWLHKAADIIFEGPV
jgi:hypothetical protein